MIIIKHSTYGDVPDYCQRVAMPYCQVGNRSSGVELAMRHRLWSVHLRDQRLVNYG